MCSYKQLLMKIERAYNASETINSYDRILCILYSVTDSAISFDDMLVLE